MKNSIKSITVHFTLLLILLFSAMVQAEHQKLIMGRSIEAFPETMTALQDEIKKAGYTLSFVQRVDVGLTGMGFKTDKYRVVFFGKPEEIEQLPKKYPQLAPYLPLAIAIFAEEQETVLTAMSPEFLAPAYLGEHPELKVVFDRWKKDMETIIEGVCYPQD